MWAVLDIREGGRYGRVVSRHRTEDAAEEALVREVRRQLGNKRGDALTHLMWTVAEIDDEDEVGERVVHRRQPGRPALGNQGRSQVLSIKVSADERRAWQEQADAAEVTIGEWIRRRCNA